MTLPGLRRLFGVAALLLLLAQPPGALGSRAGGAVCSGPPADLLVVMGAAQYDGEPSPAFARRLERAFELFDLGCAPQILVTGGKQPGHPCSSTSGAPGAATSSGTATKYPKVLPPEGAPVPPARIDH